MKMMKMKNAILMMGLAVAAVGCAQQPELTKPQAQELVRHLWKTDTVSTELNTANRDLVDSPAIKELESKHLLTVKRKWIIADGGDVTMMLTDAGRKYELKNDGTYPEDKRLFVALRSIDIKDIKHEKRGDRQFALVNYQVDYKNVSPFAVLEHGLKPATRSAEFEYKFEKWEPVAENM